MTLRPGSGRAQLERVLIETRSARVDLGRSDRVRWAYANAEESGFYRPVHDAALLEAMTEDLDRLAPAERMGLVGHQWAAFRAGRAELGPRGGGEGRSGTS